MKHLLILLISILLLSSPVIGDNHKGETLYRWGEYPDYKWMGFGDKDTHPVYKGQVENGKPHGLGILTYIYGNNYVGEFKDGREHGQGTYTGAGTRYVGGWKDGREHGQGTWTSSSDGDKYVGEYKDGLFWNGTKYDKYGNITKKVVNGKWIKQ